MSSEVPSRLSPLAIACIGVVAGAIGAVIAGASILGGLLVGSLLAAIVSGLAALKSRLPARTAEHS